MGTKTVRVDEDVYRRIEAHKREDESFSEAIERLIGSLHPAETITVLDGLDADALEAAIEELDTRSKAGLGDRAM